MLENRQSGLVADVRGGSTADGAPVIQWPRNDRPNQQFRLEPSGDGYQLVARHSGRVLDVWRWNRDEGTQLRQYRDLDGANQRFRLATSSGGFVRLLAAHSGQAVGVQGRSRDAGAPVTQEQDRHQYNQQWELVPVGSGAPAPAPEPSAPAPTPAPPAPAPPPAPPAPPAPPVPGDGPQGWASQGGGTTGGGSAAPTTVTSADALAAAVAGDAPKVVRVSGTIRCSGMLRVGSNTTVLGDGRAAAVTGCGLSVYEARNVVIRNIAFSGWDDDAVNIEGSTNVWVDHNSFSHGYDGSVDTKRGSDLVTISWNRFSDHDKNSLVGHSDGNGSQDRGRLRVTYHHNWFDGVNQRNPRVRFGNPVHVYNNYYDGVGASGGYGVASTTEAGVLVEGNYFEDTRDPFHLGEGSSPDGSLVARDNHFVGSGDGEQGGQVAPVPYRYPLDPATSVKSLVTAGAGAGRL
ncbi:pectate lyase family protein [Thalassiella azotivora]